MLIDDIYMKNETVYHFLVARDIVKFSRFSFLFRYLVDTHTLSKFSK